MAVDKEICLKIFNRALMKPLKSESELKAELIATILDRVKPIPENAPRDVKEAIDMERQLLVLRTGWGNMPIKELRKFANK